MTTDRVELLPAFLWICHACGRDNFARCRMVDRESLEGTEILEDAVEECAELTRELGLTVDGYFLMAPQTVTCAHCQAEFETEIDGEQQ